MQGSAVAPTVTVTAHGRHGIMPLPQKRSEYTRGAINTLRRAPAPATDCSYNGSGCVRRVRPAVTAPSRVLGFTGRKRGHGGNRAVALLQRP